MEWKPFDTAPKRHAHEILVRAGKSRHAVVMWLNGCMVIDDPEFASGWYISDGHNDPIWYRAWRELTEWRELPS